MGSPNQPVNYLAILRSRRTAETLVRRFDLTRVYEIADGSMEKSIAAFNDNYSMDVSDDGSIRIEVSDKDSVRAAMIANGVVDVLNSIAIELGVSEARNNRTFLEKRVSDARGELSKAEEELKKYQEVRGMPLLLSDDARAAATAIGDLYTKRLRLDIDLSVLSRTAGEDNSAYKQLTIERAELERRLSAFPQLGMEAFRLYRNLLIQQKILEFLVPLYEQARIDEQKDVPVVLVLDKAVPAERKDRPKRSLIVAIASVIALLVSVFSYVVRKRLFLFERQHPDRVAAVRAIFQKRQVG
jgi:capsule polysaccharide export protein KpsE/RkpR